MKGQEPVDQFNSFYVSSVKTEAQEVCELCLRLYSTSREYPEPGQFSHCTSSLHMGITFIPCHFLQSFHESVP